MNTEHRLHHCRMRCTERYYKGISTVRGLCTCYKYASVTYRIRSSFRHRTQESQAICRSCGSLSNKNLLLVYLLHERAEVKSLTCSRCGSLECSKGPRWWVCSMCNRGCSSNVHP